MTADDREPQGILEANVSRLFERLKEPDLRAETTRRRILDRLLQETSLPRRTRTGAIARRWMRWAGLAAALVVIAGLLTIDRDRPAKTGNGNPVVSFAIHHQAIGTGLMVVADVHTGVAALGAIDRQLPVRRPAVNRIVVGIAEEKIAV